MYRMNTKCWSVLRTVFLIAGAISGISLYLGLVWDQRMLFLTGLVALMQIFFAATGYCPMAIFLDKLGLPNHCKDEK